MCNLWGMDSFWFRIQGKSLQRFLNLAASQGIRLAHLRWEPDAFSACGLGRDYRRLQELAISGSWKFSVIQRRGPGRMAERLLRRPGILLGVLLFFVLLRVMSLLVWTIDFDKVPDNAQERIRFLLDECGIREGALLTEESLQTAQALALQQSDLFGWISLNFSGGCLFIECTPAEEQSVQDDPEEIPLYAKIAGEVLAVRSESGFPVVIPGQTVTQGELLVDKKRLDRDGKEVLQGVRGEILARCQTSYTFFQPLESQADVLSGQKDSIEQFCFFGILWPDDLCETAESDYQTREWIPLHIGRLRLPGCLYRVTRWTQTAGQLLLYSPEQASALAQRACREQLFEEFPDAVIENEEKQIVTSSQGVSCTIHYQFRANIAVPQQPQ